MRPVHALIFHAEPAGDAGPLVRALADGRLALASRQRRQWLAAGAETAEILAGPPDSLTFGERLRGYVAAMSGGAGAVGGTGGIGRASAHGRVSGGDTAGGLVVSGSGAMPLARVPDLRRFVDVAAGPAGHALANNRYSADVVAISRAADLAELPPLPSDNALPRWLEEGAGVTVVDLRRRWRLGFDVDTPLDLLLLEYAGRGHSPAGGRGADGPSMPLLGERLEALAAVLRNRRAELLVAGRVSTATLQFLQSGVACRVRALVEERGLRAASELAQSGGTRIGRRATTAATAATATTTATATAAERAARPPRSVLGELLELDGADSLGRHVAALADAALIDTRVLMAHRFGATESVWPVPEDRFASDLLDPGSVTDSWLRALTTSAVDASTPILLGGHTLVNGGLRLLAQRATTAAT